ncbi:MAG TPA: bifunctional methylenetetrahydrofolate dehydrogenase/methenyltetrahydrofolate cyclohydrolase FolD [Candidatus Obscuribacterales bacterium]
MLKEQETAATLDGKLVAKITRDNLAQRIKEHVDHGRRPPGLAVILVGDDPASEIYVRNKVSACRQVGVESFFNKFGAAAKEAQILECIDKLNADPNVDGILVQLPLPGGLEADRILARLLPEKDADGLHPYNLGLLMSGKPGLRPCTPLGIMTVLDYYAISVSGKRAVVIGRSNLVGKPIAALLMQADATVTVCHSKTADLPAYVKTAEILVVAMGKREFVEGSWIKPGACVIDVGIHYVSDTTNPEAKPRIVGDVRYEEAKHVAGFITPVPGGVGPMTVAMLLSNTFQSYEKRLSLR